MSWFANWPQYLEGNTRLRKDADHSRFIGVRFNKQGKLHARVVLGTHKTSRSLNPPDRILKVYMEVLTGFRHVYYKDAVNNTCLSQGCILETSPSVGGMYVPRTEEGVKSFQLPESSSKVSRWLRPLNDFFQ